MTTVYRVHQDSRLYTSAACISEYGIFSTLGAARDATESAAMISLERWFGRKLSFSRDTETRRRIINPPSGEREIEFEITDKGTYIPLGMNSITITITSHELDKFTGEVR
ncbi:hypothetical protein LCGC14_0890800 [marine sediment metagenome]|uniref:Uncharacterized protein n=1 Tax=marine sediment metagenome TaxID=412755 RepID=A0A0F9NZD5_9ZZZZ